jgi:hypothetical protein
LKFPVALLLSGKAFHVENIKMFVLLQRVTAEILYVRPLYAKAQHFD